MNARRDQRKGIALVVVLGFLSILILMAVTLITLTRTERLVSSYTSEEVRARHLARGALDRSIADLCAYFQQARLARLRPQDAVFISLGQGGRVGTNTGMFRGSETNWLPWSYLVSPAPNYNVRQIWDTQAEWIPIYDPANNTSLLGRIAYAIVDCTGLYDVNVLGSRALSGGLYANQPVRKSIADVGLERLPEVLGGSGGGGGATAAELKYNRDCYHAFLTFREVLVFNDGIKGRYSCDEKSVFSPAVGIRTVGPYSLSYDDGSWWDPGQWSWQKGGPANVPPNVNEWTPGQAAAVFSGLLNVNASIAAQMAEALMDYRDTNRLPANTSGLTVEAVPMLNEVVLEIRFDDSGAGIVANIEVKVETWYPFPSITPLQGYTFGSGRPTLSGRPGGGGDINVAIVKLGGVPPSFDAVPPSSIDTRTAISYNNGKPQHWVTINYQVPLPGLASGDQVRVGARLLKLTLCDERGSTIDEIGGGIEFAPSPRITIPSSRYGPVSLQVNDPRLNHQSDNWSRQGGGDLGEINVAARQAGCDAEGRDMYVRDNDLESVAELGFISIGQPWQTIPLYSRGGRDLLARFRAAPPGRSWLNEPTEWTNGMLNPNSHFPIWTNAFFGVNLAEVPDHPVTNAWRDASQVGALASSIANMLNVTQFYSGADWVLTDALQENGALAVAGLNNNQREAIIRNTYRMFSPNGNLYSVFVIAQTFLEGNTNLVAGEKRLVALVWHDPFPSTGTQRHRWFVRWMRWLEE